MNILVVADSFSKGGLETHIDTYYKYLSKNNNVMFAFGNYEKGKYLNGAKIYSDELHFSAFSSIIDFREDVEALVRIIKDNKIDLIQVHPFYSLFPAIVAANITSIKIVFTAHGRISFNYFNNHVDTVLYHFAIEEVLNAVFCVSKNGQEWALPYAKDKAYYLPNLINLDDYPEHKVVNNKRWALISRLDNDKKTEIIKFFSMLDQLDIDFVDVYGSGSCEDEIKDFVKKNKLDSKVWFTGYKENISDVLNNKYNGVIGQGRVVLESLAMNYPTILMGYGKIAGLIDKKMFNQIKDINFIPTTLSECSLFDLQQKLLNINKDNYLREEIKKEFSVQRLDDYLEIIKRKTFSSVDVLNNWYNELALIKDQASLVYSSLEVFNLLVKYIVPYSSDIELKSLVNAFTKINELNQIVNIDTEKMAYTSSEIKRLNDDLANAKSNIDNLNKELSSLEKRVKVTENIGLKTLIKRAFKNAFKRHK